MPQITVSDELLKWLQSENNARLEWFGPIEDPTNGPADNAIRKQNYRMMEEFQRALSESEKREK